MKGTERGSEMKKTLAILLSLALIVCMMPTTVFAVGEPSIDDSMVSVSASTVYNGVEQVPTVTVKKGETTLIEGTDYTVTWVAEPLSKAEDFDGKTEPSEFKNAGTYSVLVKGNETYTGSVVKQYVIAPYDSSKLKIIVDNQIKSDGDYTPAFNSLNAGSVKYYYGNKETTKESVKFAVDDLDIAFVKNSDTSYTTTFTFKSNVKTNYTTEKLLSSTFSLVSDIKNATLVSATNASPTASPISSINGGEYDGKAKKIENLIALYNGNTAGSKKLEYNKDYVITCADSTSAGQHAVTIKGIGSFGGTKSTTLNIVARDANKYVKADSIPDQTFSSQDDVKPVLRDTTLNTVLKETVDYMVDTPSVGQAGGQGLVTVRFTGNYTGSPKEIPFNVVSDDKNLENSSLQVYYGNTDVTGGTLRERAYLYNGSAQPLNNIVVYTDNTKKTVLSSSYYSLSYKYEKDGKTISTTSPVDATTYNVYLVGKNGYAGKRLLGTYTIPKYNTSNVTVSVSMANAVSVPTVTVKSKYENITFVKDKDYSVYYSVNTTTGKVFVIVSALDGNLAGTSISGDYPIVAKSITSCTATFTNGKSSAAYTGYNIPVDVTVKDGYYTPLSKGTHYKVTYKDAAGKTVTYIKDAGVYTVEIEGIGLYTGKLTLTFTVTGNDISGYTVTLKESSVNVSDKAQTPVIESVKKGTATLASTNYTVSYQDAAGKTVTSMKDPGTYKVVVTGKNAYSGSTYATFRIIGLTQTITPEENIYKAYYNYSAPFVINAKASVATNLTYTSSNPSVANVSATGTVTVNKVGRAVITISAPVTGKYDAASTTVVVKVYPKKGAMSRSLWTDGKKKQIKVRWYYQEGATKYQIRYSRKSNFSTYATKNAVPYGENKYTTNTATIKNLKSKTKYYVKVRAIYTDATTGEVYYGKWSTVKSITTK